MQEEEEVRERDTHTETETNHTEPPRLWAWCRREQPCSPPRQEMMQQFISDGLRFPRKWRDKRADQEDLRPQSEEQKQEVGREPKDTASAPFAKRSCVQLSNEYVCGAVLLTSARSSSPEAPVSSSRPRRCVFLLRSQPPALVTRADTYLGLRFQEIG